MWIESGFFCDKYKRPSHLWPQKFSVSRATKTVSKTLPVPCVLAIDGEVSVPYGCWSWIIQNRFYHWIKNWRDLNTKSYFLELPVRGSYNNEPYAGPKFLQIHCRIGCINRHFLWLLLFQRCSTSSSKQPEISKSVLNEHISYFCWQKWTLPWFWFVFDISKMKKMMRLDWLFLFLKVLLIMLILHVKVFLQAVADSRCLRGRGEKMRGHHMYVGNTIKSLYIYGEGRVLDHILSILKSTLSRFLYSKGIQEGTLLCHI